MLKKTDKDQDKRKTNAVDVSIGARIKMRRLEVGMSQQELGEALGVSFQQIQKYEKGVNGVRGSRMEQIAEALGVSVSFLYEQPRQGTVSSVVDEFIKTREGIRIAKAFMGIKDPVMRAAIVTIVEAAVPGE
jgi:transcriptional regulator with XRE-family HTH domain